jgi:hypothetical protein
MHGRSLVQLLSLRASRQSGSAIFSDAPGEPPQDSKTAAFRRIRTVSRTRRRRVSSGQRPVLKEISLHATIEL